MIPVLLKSQVKAHSRRSKSGGIAQVKEHHREGRTRKWSGWTPYKSGVHRWEKKKDAETAAKGYSRLMKKMGLEVDVQVEFHGKQKERDTGKMIGREGWGFSSRSLYEVPIVNASTPKAAPTPKPFADNPVPRPGKEKKFKVVHFPIEKGTIFPAKTKAISSPASKAAPAGRPKKYKKTPIKKGVKVLFKQPGSRKRSEGTVTRVNKLTYVIEVDRTKTSWSGGSFTVKKDEVVASRDAERLKAQVSAAKKETAVNPLKSADHSQLRADVSRSRKVALEKKLNMKEEDILLAKTKDGRQLMVGYLKAMTNRYIEQSGLDRSHFPMIMAEYYAGMMERLRYMVPKATKAQIKEFKQHLKGEVSTSEMWRLAGHAGKKMAHKYINDYRAKLKKEETVDWQAIESPLSDSLNAETKTALVGKFGDVMGVHGGQEDVTFSNEANVRTLVDSFLKKLPFIEEEVLRYKYQIGKYEKAEALSNEAIADILNERVKGAELHARKVALAKKRGKPVKKSGKKYVAPYQGKYVWTRNNVGSTINAAVAKIRAMEGIEVLQPFMKSHPDDESRPLSYLKKGLNILQSLIKSKADAIGSAPEPQKVICVDLDGVIADYSKGFQGENIFGHPIAGAIEGLTTLKDAGWRIIIHTCRPRSQALTAYLVSNGIPYDHINEPSESRSGKPMADVYLDDRAVRFTDWESALKEVTTLKKSLYLIQPFEERLEKAEIDHEVHEQSYGELIWVNEEGFEKSYSSELKKQYPAGRWVTVKEGPLAHRHIFIVPHPDGTATILAGGGPALKHKVLQNRSKVSDSDAKQAEKQEEKDAKQAAKPEEEPEKKPGITPERKEEFKARKKELKKKTHEVREKMATFLREQTGIEIGITETEMAAIEKKVSRVKDNKEKAAKRLAAINALKKEKDEVFEEIVAHAKQGLLENPPEDIKETESDAPVDKEGKPTLHKAVRDNYEELLRDYYVIQSIRRETSEINTILRKDKDKPDHFTALSFDEISAQDIKDAVADEAARSDEMAAHYKLITTAKGYKDEEGVDHQVKGPRRMRTNMRQGGYEAITAIVGESTGSTIMDHNLYDKLGPENAARLARHFIAEQVEDPKDALKDLVSYLEREGDSVAIDAIAEGNRFMEMANKVMDFGKGEDSIMDAAQARGTRLFYQNRAYEAYGQAEGALGQAAELAYALADKPKDIEFKGSESTLREKAGELGLKRGDYSIKKAPRGSHSMTITESGIAKLIKERKVSDAPGAIKGEGHYTATEIKNHLANKGERWLPGGINPYIEVDGTMRPVILDPNQQAATHFIAQQKRAYLNFEAGTGKSLIALSSKAHIDDLRKKAGREGTKTIVFMPDKVQANFKEEVEKFTDYNVVIVPTTSSAKKKDKIYAQADANTIFIASHEKARDHAKHIKDAGFDYVIADEAHKITQRESSKKSQKSQGLGDIAKQAEHYVAMTGTPTPSDLSQLYYHASLIDPEKFHSQAAFMQRFKTAHRGGGLKEKIQQFMAQELDDNVFTAKKHLDVERRMHTHISELTPAQRKEYRETQDAFLGKSIQVFQRENRHANTVNNKPHAENGKYKDIKKIIDNHIATKGKDEKVIIYAKNQAAWKNIADFLEEHYPGEGYVHFTGGSATDKRFKAHNQNSLKEAKHNFKHDPKVRFAIHSNAGVEGINLQYDGDGGGATTAVALASGVDSWSILDQFFSRAHRKKAQKDVDAHMVLSDTPYDLGTQVRLSDKRSIGELVQNRKSKAPRVARRAA